MTAFRLPRMLICLGSGLMSLILLFYGMGAEAAEAQDDPPARWVGLSPQERALLEELRGAGERLMKPYQNSQMEIIRRETRYPASPDEDHPPRHHTSRLTYSIREGKYYRIEQTDLDPEKKSPTAYYSLWIVRPEGGGVAERFRPDDSLELTRIWPDGTNQFLDFFRWDTTHAFLWGAHSLRGACAESLIFEQPMVGNIEFQVTEVVGREEGGERLVTVTARGTTADGSSTRKVEIVFYRDRAWAIKEHTSEWTTDHGRILQGGEVEYEGTCEGIPRVKHVRLWTEVEEGNRVWEYEYALERFTPGPPPWELFLPDESIEGLDEIPGLLPTLRGLREREEQRSTAE